MEKFKQLISLLFPKSFSWVGKVPTHFSDEPISTKEKIDLFINFLIPERFTRDSFAFRKAETLVYIHIFVLVSILILGMLNVFNEDSHFPFMTAFIMTIAIIFIFKKTGNFLLSGNLLVFTAAVCIAPLCLNTGGVFSDNFFWLIIIPVMSFLLANGISGIVWSILFIGFSVWLFGETLQNELLYKEQVEDLASLYYFMSCMGVFSIIMAVVWVYEMLQGQFVFTLLEQKKEIENKAAELQKMQQKLTEQNRELEQFAYTVSHDLKQPLRSILGFSKHLEKNLNINNDLNDRDREYLDFIRNSSESMQNLIDSLLEYSKLDMKGKGLENTNLEDLLELIKHNLTQQISENNATVTYSNLPHNVLVMKVKLMQLFQNMISNALKFGKKDVPPAIHISCQNQENNWLFQIQDNGIGIDPKNHQKVFNLFDKVHAKSEYAGSGIGLATCKKIINQHGGNIWLESELGEGTTFFFTIPKVTNNLNTNEIAGTILDRKQVISN